MIQYRKEAGLHSSKFLLCSIARCCHATRLLALIFKFALRFVFKKNELLTVH